MPNPALLADLITQGVQGPTGDQDFSLVQGRVVSWDRLTGINTVELNGTFITNVSALHAGIPTWFNPGDSVQLVRKQSRYFILGKVASPGGTAGSSVQFGTALSSTTLVNNSTYVSLGLTKDVYLGSSRAVLVIFTAYAEVTNARVNLSFTISGATTMGANAFNGHQVTFYANTGVTATMASAANNLTGLITVGPGAGLNAGLNTFSVVGMSDFIGTSGSAKLSNPGITLIPL